MVARRRLDDAALGQVVASGRGLGGLPQIARVETGRVLQEPEQPTPFRPPPLIGRRGLLVFEPDAVAVGERLTAAAKSRLSVSRTKAMWSPPRWQPKQ